MLIQFVATATPELEGKESEATKPEVTVATRSGAHQSDTLIFPHKIFVNVETTDLISSTFEVTVGGPDPACAVYCPFTVDHRSR